MNLSTKQKQRHKCREQMYGYQGMKMGWDELGEQNWHIYTTLYKNR